MERAAAMPPSQDWIGIGLAAIGGGLIKPAYDFLLGNRKIQSDSALAWQEEARKLRDELRAEKTELKAEVTKLQGRTNELEDRVETLETDKKELGEKLIVTAAAAADANSRAMQYQQESINLKLELQTERDKNRILQEKVDLLEKELSAMGFTILGHEASTRQIGIVPRVTEEPI